MTYPEPIRPSAVEQWTRCPTLWMLENVQGWHRPGTEFTKQDLSLLVGTALHAGMAAYWRGHPDAALPALEAGWPQGGSEFSLEGTALLLEKMVQATIAWCKKELEGAIPLLIEHSLGPDGATPDLVIRNRGQVEVIDWKSHMEVKPDRIPYRLQDPDHSHQFQDYIWRVSEYLNEPVRLFRAVHIIGLPRLIVRETTFVPSEAQQAEWLRQARRKWHLMAMMKVDPALVYRNEGGCKPYGADYPCPMWTACWECHGQPGAIAQFYTRKEPT